MTNTNQFRGLSYVTSCGKPVDAALECADGVQYEVPIFASKRTAAEAAEALGGKLSTDKKAAIAAGEVTSLYRDASGEEWAIVGGTMPNAPVALGRGLLTYSKSEVVTYRDRPGNKHRVRLFRASEGLTPAKAAELLGGRFDLDQPAAFAEGFVNAVVRCPQSSGPKDWGISSAINLPTHGSPGLGAQAQARRNQRNASDFQGNPYLPWKHRNE